MREQVVKLKSFKGYKFIPFLVLCVGVISSLNLFFFVRHWERSNISAKVYSLGEDRALLFENSVHDHVDLLRAVASLYISSESVERNEFRSFSLFILKNHNDLLDVDWLPRIRESERIAYENRVSREINANYKIKILTAQDNLIDTDIRKEYFPIDYVEPFDKNKAILGFDVSSDPVRKSAMDEARDAGESTATAKIKLLRGNKGDVGCRMFMPIYKNGFPSDTLEQRRENLIGFVSLLFEIKGAFDSAIRYTQPIGLNTYIYDVTTDGNEELLYYHRARLQAKHDRVSVGKYSVYYGIEFSKIFKIADRSWKIVCRPSLGFMERNKVWQSWAFLLLGLIFTLLVTIYIASILNRTEKIELLVKQRTAELKESQERYKTLFDSSRDAIMTASPDRGFLSGNKATLEMFKCEDEEEFKSFDPSKLSPEYQPDGQLSSVKSQEMMRIALEKGSNSFEWVHKRIDGEEFFASVLLSRMQVRDDIFLQATVRDITDRKKAEEALSEAVQFNKEIISSATQGIVVIDRQFRILIWNKFLEMGSGLSASEVLNKNLFEVLPFLKNTGLLERALNGEFVTTGDIPYVKKPEGKGWMHCFCGPCRNTKGEVTGIVVVVSEISERKDMEDNLRANEERFRTLVANVPGVIYRCLNDSAWTMKFISNKVHEMCGYPAEDFIDNRIRSYASIILPEDKDMVWKSIQDSISKKQPYDISYRIINAEGKLMYIHEKGQGVFSQEGNLLYLDGVMLDITAQYQSEEQIRKLFAGVEYSPAIVVITDNKGNIEYVNKKFVDVTGYSLEEAKGKNPRILKSGERKAEFYKQLWDTILSGKDWEGEFHNKKKNGELYWEYARISPIKNDKGEITNFIAIKEDITGKKLTEEKLNKAYKTTNSIIENAPFGIYIVNNRGSVEYVNPAMLVIGGSTKEQFLSLNMFDFPLFQAIGLSDKIRECFASGNSFRMDSIEYTSYFGKKKTFRNFYGILLEEGEANKVLIVVEDITERKRLEKMKDEFVNTVSHELRTPLSIMREGISQILEGMHGKVNPKQRHFLVVSLNGIDRITRIVNNLLDLSKIESGRIELKIEPVDFTEIVKSVGSVLKSVAEIKKLKIKYNFAQPKIEIPADKDRITEVFLNLINNAIKFTDKGYIQVNVVDKGDCVESSIVDTGIGIAEEDAPKLFTKFEQFGRPAVVIEKGIGLGLVICKGIVELHGGKIWVSSQLGKGTTITFTIPRKP